MTITPPKLGQRLTLIESLVPASSRLVDVGSDHALLPISFLLKHPEAKAVAIDNKEKPLAVADRNRRRFGLSDRLALVLADGLPPGLIEATDSVVIAGMGGVEIKGIVERAKSLPERFILSPHSRADVLRAYLAFAGLSIESEAIVGEGRRVYVVMEVRKGKPYELSLHERWIGPIMLRARDERALSPSLKLYLERLAKHLRNCSMTEPELASVHQYIMEWLGDTSCLEK